MTGRAGGKDQPPVVPRGFEKRQEVDPAWPPVQVALRGGSGRRPARSGRRGRGALVPAGRSPGRDVTSLARRQRQGFSPDRGAGAWLVAGAGGRREATRPRGARAVE